MSQKPPNKDKPTQVSLLESDDTSSLDLKICFVSLVDARQIEGIDILRQVLERYHFTVENFEYKLTSKIEVRKPINPKIKNGPSEKVIVEERVNINTQLKTLRQLSWRVSKDPENVLLLQISRTKGESLCVPLIFSKILNDKKQILVTGITNRIKLQLTAKPDLSLKKIPLAILQNEACKIDLIKRSKRLKGMQAAMRELQEITSFPKDLKDKILGIITGKKIELTDAEAINLLLLSDLHNRYSTMFQNFQQEVVTQASPVPALTKQFIELTQGIKTSILVSKLAPYLGENADRCKKNEHIFSLLYRNLKRLEDKKITRDGIILSHTSLFNEIKSLFLLTRSQQDPFLWDKCLFFMDVKDEETSSGQNQKTIEQLTNSCKSKLVKTHTASSKNLFEQYLINNIQNYCIGKKVWLPDKYLSKYEYGLINSAVLPQLHFRFAKGTSQKIEKGLFVDKLPPVGKLYNSIHFVSRSYGSLIHNRLLNNTRQVIEQGYSNLLKRYRNLFFDIFYSRVVTEPGFPIPRRTFLLFLQKSNFIRKPKEIGYTNPKLDIIADELLTEKIIQGSKESLFKANIDNDAFNKEYAKSRIQFFSFIKSIEDLSKREEAYNPAKIFIEVAQKGKYNFRSSYFRKHLRNTFLYEELNEIVINSCSEIKTIIASTAINNKVVLQIPSKFDSILFIGNVFKLSINQKDVSLFLLSATGDTETFNSISRNFSHNFGLHLKAEDTAERKGLIQAMRLLQEYQKNSIEYIRNISIILLDRHIQNLLIAEKEKNKLTPGHIKYYFSDHEKLAIGNIRDMNLSNVFQYKTKGSKQEIGLDNYSFGQFLQSMHYFEEAKHDLNSRRDVLKKVLDLLNKFSEKLKSTEKWKSYYQIIKQFDNMISVPISSFDNKLLNLISISSNKIKKLVDKEEYKDGIIGLLHAEWKRRNPENQKEIYFFTPFLSLQGSIKENVVLKIRTACELIIKFDQKKCILFFPEGAKDHQINQMFEIDAFIKKNFNELNVFVETHVLSEDHIDELCKTFHPKNYFVIDKLVPVNYEMKISKELEKILNKSTPKSKSA
ncbi:MAG: hypothetical protein HOD92_21100 [Deltaproteobacteria bacterium]|jgi:hypothetical protein|nr:hypothetical protein [Deltaproteobacteria bacterium]MBT4527758.1 hypothetical protein [Deltaproteobacteria bacterium]